MKQFRGLIATLCFTWNIPGAPPFAQGGWWAGNVPLIEQCGARMEIM